MNALSPLLPHLLRPWWLLALLALPLLWWRWHQRARADSPWTRAVDAHLLPSLLQTMPGARRAWPMTLFAVGYVLAVLALAGPAWQRATTATWEVQAPLVVVEDMSSHMRVADLAPTRALRERLKVQQLIAQRRGGQMGLVAYAGDAFTVAPISDDAHSLDDMVVALAPDTMPVDGQRADLALDRAADLLSQAGFTRGRILLLSDDADPAAIAMARRVHARGYRVDVIGVGSPQGGLLPDANGSFVHDAGGQVMVARRDDAALRDLAAAGGGLYAPIDTSGQDLASLGVLDVASQGKAAAGSSQAMVWRDTGPWLLLLLLPLAALAFRRGWLAAVLLAVLVMPVQPVRAAPLDAWNGLWQRRDQRADQALRTGDATAATTLAQTPAQRAAAAYLRGDYAAAVADWSARDDADADYNRGNALAKMKRYEDAISAWQRALAQQPGMADAKANIEAVRKLLAQRKPPPQQSSSDSRQAQARNKRQQPSQRQQAQQQQAQQLQAKQQKSQQQQGQQQQAQQQQAQQQQAQQQQAQQRQAQQRQAQQQQAQQQQAQQQQAQQQQAQQQQQAPRKPPQQAQAATASPPSDHGKDASAAAQQAQATQPRPDAARQAAADAAQQRAMRQALGRKDHGDRKQALASIPSTAQRERQQADERLLQRVPDDPGALLKRKFWLEYQRRQQGDSR